MSGRSRPGLASTATESGLVVRDQVEQGVSAPLDRCLTYGPAPLPGRTPLVAPRPQPTGEAVQRILAGDAHRAVRLMGSARAESDRVIGDDPRDTDVDDALGRLDGP